MIDFVVDQYQPCMDMLQQCFRALEEELFEKSSGDGNLERFYRLKNELTNLQAAAVPLIDVCTQLMRFHEEIVPKDSHVYYRDILDHVSRVTQAADRMREMINCRDAGGLGASNHSPERGSEKTCRLGRYSCNSDDGIQLVWHEFRAYARTQVALGISRRYGDNRCWMRCPLPPVAPSRLALILGKTT